MKTLPRVASHLNINGEWPVNNRAVSHQSQSGDDRLGYSCSADRKRPVTNQDSVLSPELSARLPRALGTGVQRGVPNRGVRAVHPVHHGVPRPRHVPPRRHARVGLPGHGIAWPVPVVVAVHLPGVPVRAPASVGMGAGNSLVLKAPVQFVGDLLFMGPLVPGTPRYLTFQKVLYY
jgi:hypothetical protein